MDAEKLGAMLLNLRACREAREFSSGKSFKEAWSTCDRADWMLWIVGKMADKEGWPTRKQVVLVACDCAETALRFVPAGEDRPRKCLEVVRAWANGNATLDDVREARHAADAYAAYAAYAAAAYAAYAADAAYAAYAAAAYAADADAADAADAYAARRETLKSLANLVREKLTVPTE